MPTQSNLLFALLFIGISCSDTTESFEIIKAKEKVQSSSNEIWGISLPQGFSYVDGDDSASSKWLLGLKLKKISLFTCIMEA